YFFQAEDGIRDFHVTGVQTVCSSDLATDSTISLLLFATALAATTLLVVLHVSTEGAGGCKLAELVPDHGLGDEHRDVLATVVHRDRKRDVKGMRKVNNGPLNM